MQISRKLATALVLFSLFIQLLGADTKEPEMTLYDFDVTRINGEKISMAHYKNRLLLIVNVASKCGFTSQYEGLEKLYQAYKDEGFMIFGFPCNQFGSQEPGTHEEIASFCRLNYGVSFDMFEKIDVNGANTHPLYRYLKSEATGIFGSESIKWNFTKFLIDQEGKVVARFGSTTTPEAIREEIDALLGHSAP